MLLSTGHKQPPRTPSILVCGVRKKPKGIPFAICATPDKAHERHDIRRAQKYLYTGPKVLRRLDQG